MVIGNLCVQELKIPKAIIFFKFVSYFNLIWTIVLEPIL